MLRSLTLALALTLAAAPAFAKPGTWTIDSTHSSIVFSVKHLMVTDVKGEFGKITGTATLDFEKPSSDSVEATVDVATINTRDEKRDGHLKSPDFLDLAKFPTMTFKSTKIENGKMTGDLTIHGVTKSVTFDLKGPYKPIKTPWGSVVTAASATTVIKRGDFGLKWNKALEAGGVVVGEDVTITIDVELQGPKPETAAKK